MKKVLLLAMAVLTLVGTARANSWWDNYRPDNWNVKLGSTNLPIVWIDVDGNYIDRDERITARMKIIHNGDGNLNYADTVAHPGQNIDYEGYVALRYRGSSSFSMSDKKPYSFRPLDKPLEEGGEKKKVNILGMGKDNNWALLAPYADKSMLRDLLAFEVSRPWMEYTPQGRFCEMYLDGIYYGVYILTEVVSKGKHRVNLPDPGESGDSITGGYIMEVNRTDGEVTHVSKYHPVSNTGTSYNNQYIHFQYKSPDYEDMTDDQVTYINQRIDQMERALWNYRPTGTPSYRNYLDMDNFVDYQLAMELGHNVDGYRLSGKFFKRRDSEDARFKMVVWDNNLSYGNADYYNAWRTNTCLAHQHLDIPEQQHPQQRGRHPADTLLVVQTQHRPRVYRGAQEPLGTVPPQQPARRPHHGHRRLAGQRAHLARRRAAQQPGMAPLGTICVAQLLHRRQLCRRNRLAQAVAARPHRVDGPATWL